MASLYAGSVMNATVFIVSDKFVIFLAVSSQKVKFSQMTFYLIIYDNTRVVVVRVCGLSLLFYYLRSFSDRIIDGKRRVKVKRRTGLMAAGLGPSFRGTVISFF